MSFTILYQNRNSFIDSWFGPVLKDLVAAIRRHAPISRGVGSRAITES